MEDGGVEAPRRRGRPTGSKTKPKDHFEHQPKKRQPNGRNAYDEGYASGRDIANRDDAPDMMAMAVARGVTVSWLAQVLDMDAASVKARLKDCPPIVRRKNGFIYECKTAMPYLLTPKFNVEEYMKTMKVEDLPTKLQDQYWSAMNKRQRWEENAGNLWRTTKLMAAFGSIFLLIRNTTMLWVDQVERKTRVTDEQRKILEGLVRDLQASIYEKIKELPLHSQTRPMLAEEQEIRAPAKPDPEDLIDEDDDDDLSVI